MKMPLSIFKRASQSSPTTRTPLLLRIQSDETRSVCRLSWVVEWYERQTHLLVHQCEF